MYFILFFTHRVYFTLGGIRYYCDVIISPQKKKNDDGGLGFTVNTPPFVHGADAAFVLPLPLRCPPHLGNYGIFSKRSSPHTEAPSIHGTRGHDGFVGASQAEKA